VGDNSSSSSSSSLVIGNERYSNSNMWLCVGLFLR
jgi:hypothetical protein